MKLIIGFITYGDLTAKYLPYFLPSLEKARPKDSLIMVADNSEDENNKNKKYIEARYPQIYLFRSGRNLGFAKACNILINRAMRAGTEYFLILNPDIILEPEAVAKLVKAVDNDEKLGSASPKILKWDFSENKKTSVIDSCGIVLMPGLKFIDLGQGQVDRGQFDKAQILGPSGAVGIFRIKALQNISLSRGGRSGQAAEAGLEFFDKLFFMYKEDCDLAYRLHLAGWQSKLVSDSVVYHDRTGSGGGGNLKIALNRRKKSRPVKIWSFYGQHLIFLKHWHKQNLWSKINIVWHGLKMFIFALLFERYLLKEYKKLWKIKKIINS